MIKASDLSFVLERGIRAYLLNSGKGFYHTTIDKLYELTREEDERESVSIKKRNE